jgi:1-acyl-sn-glycerol-3-phosphate acyltransferase
MIKQVRRRTIPISPSPIYNKSMTNTRTYLHSRWEPMRHFLRFLMDKIGFRFLAKIDSVQGIENIPEKGAAILIYNHISFIDPVAVMASIRRNVVPMAKVEAVNTPLFGIFTRMWGAIFVRRGEADRVALEQALAVLQSGELLLIAPEGTRSPALIEAKDGVAYLAARTGAPVIPVAVDGTEGFPSLSPKRWKQPGARIRIGKPFHFRVPHGRIPRDWLRQMTQESMYRLAELLPPARRGFYGDLNLATAETIER